MMAMQGIPGVGAVVIGRNEGERLKLCLASVLAQIGEVVYVDSGSSDGSTEHAASIGVEVVSLDMSVPFSAGRARNEGFRRLRGISPGLRLVQFIDGDCVLSEGWARKASAFLDDNESYAIVTGRVKERFPERSVYNWLCDVEWRTVDGEARSCGGIFMARAKAFDSIGGFDTSMVAGEEPEMCYRLRREGWKLYSLADEMTMHDAAISRFGQWWKRSVRSGLAYAHGCYLHRKDKEPHHLRQNRRILFWALGVPAATAAAAAVLGPQGLLVLLAYPAQLARMYAGARRTFGDGKRALQYSSFNMLEKFPQFLGQLIFLRRLVLAERPRLIEYK